MNKTRAFRKSQHQAYKLGTLVGFIGLVALLSPRFESWHVRGPMNSGHENVKCEFCHLEAPGTTRQQIQANLRYALGQREQLVDFGNQPVTNENCLSCHDRPNDRHPVYRFFEPRFLQARKNLSPQLCISCHTEHKGKRVTLSDTGYCVNCHKKTKLRHDPLDVPHDRLIVLKLWDSCLGCHDFHGNHIMDVPKTVEQLIDVEKIVTYFQGGPSPYGDELHYKAKKEPSHDQ